MGAAIVAPVIAAKNLALAAQDDLIEILTDATE
jgi:hypothetical protein